MRNFVLEYFHNRYGLAKIANSRLAKFLISVLKADKRATQLSNKTKSTSTQVNTSSNKGTGGARVGKFLTDSVYCRKCGSPRPGPATKQLPLLKESTLKNAAVVISFEEIKFTEMRARPEFGQLPSNAAAATSFTNVFCRKCGTHGRGCMCLDDPYRNHTYHQCACGNIFAGDSFIVENAEKFVQRFLTGDSFFLYTTG